MPLLDAAGQAGAVAAITNNPVGQTLAIVDPLSPKMYVVPAMTYTDSCPSDTQTPLSSRLIPKFKDKC
jgi:hypothetical protein